MLKLNDLKSQIFYYIKGLLQENGIDKYFDVNNHTSKLRIIPKTEYKDKFEAYAKDRQIKLKKDRYFNIVFPIDLRRDYYEDSFLKIVNSQNDIDFILKRFKDEIKKDFQENFLEDSVFLDLITYLRGDNPYPSPSSSATISTFGYLDRILIKRFFCIADKVVLENLKDKKEIYFLGENGDGKTLLLWAILLALKYRFIQDKDTKKGEAYVGRIVDIVNKSDLIITAIDSYSTRYTIQSPNYYSYFSDDSKFINDIYAYGVHRSRSNAKSAELYGFGTLFSDDVYLRSPIEWLKDIERLELKQLNKSITLQNVINILEDLLGKNVKIRIEKDVIFEERGYPIQFDALSEGYKSVMTWVADLVSRLAENQPDVKPIEVDGKINFPYQGIVLVDEISLHLHPKWEYQIVRKLRGWFPNIQFIMTTHSPVTVLGASEEAIFYKVYKEKGITHVSEPYTSESIKNLMANGVLTSPLFDLESAAMSIAKDDSIDTSDDFTYSLIHKQIAEQVKKLKNEGKVHISPEMLNEMVAKAIEKHKTQVKI